MWHQSDSKEGPSPGLGEGDLALVEIKKSLSKAKRLAKETKPLCLVDSKPWLRCSSKCWAKSSVKSSVNSASTVSWLKEYKQLKFYSKKAELHFKASEDDLRQRFTDKQRAIKWYMRRTELPVKALLSLSTRHWICFEKWRNGVVAAWLRHNVSNLVGLPARVRISSLALGTTSQQPTQLSILRDR